MRKLFMLSGLSSNISFPDNLKQILSKEFEGLKRVVAIASTPEQFDSNDEFFYGTENKNSVISMFQDINKKFEEFDLIDNRIKEEDAIKLLDKAELLYLMPGDTYKQLDFFNTHTKLKKKIQEFEGTIVGVSAGMMNMAEKAYYLADEDYPETKFYDGLGIVDISVVPHFTSKRINTQIIKDSFEHEIYGLPDTSMIYSSNNKFIFIGECYNFKDGSTRIINKIKDVNERDNR